MGDIEFTTHMLTTFLEKYGEILQEYFISDALLGRYMSAGDLYNYIYPNKNRNEVEEDNDDCSRRRLVQQKTFSKNYLEMVNFVNKLWRDKKPMKKDLPKSLFEGNFNEVNFPKNSENAYWENLFVYAWVRSQDGWFETSKVYYESNKAKIDKTIEDIISEVDWYKKSLWKNVLSSIELFRLRTLFDTITDNNFDFVYILDWIDIFEYRVVPNVLEHMAIDFFERYCESKKFSIFQKKEFLDKIKIEVNGRTIYNYFIKCICKSSDFPYAERFGLNKQQKKKVYNIRKMMLPLKGQTSDVNMMTDEETYSDLVMLLKQMIGQTNNASNVCVSIRKIISTRNKNRQCAYSNGKSYSCLKNRTEIEQTDTLFCCCSLELFAELTTNIDITDTETIMKNLIIYHMIRNELSQQGEEDLPHPFRERQAEELEKQYIIYRTNVLTQVFNAYTSNKRLLMAIVIEDIVDNLLAEMLMVGSGLLVVEEADNVLSKIFQEEPDMMDRDRNEFINQTWRSLDMESQLLYCCCWNWKLERIRGYIVIDQLSIEERNYIVETAEKWKKELAMMHEMLLTSK